MSKVLAINWESPTGVLRFLTKDGKRVLQMEWRIERRALRSDTTDAVFTEWRDVPEVNE